MKVRKVKDYAQNKFLKRAKEAIKNPGDVLAIVTAAKSKLEKDDIKQALGSRVKDLKVFLRMMKAYALGEYKNISKKHLLMCALAVIYFLNPADLVPDVVLGLGLVDDLAVINWVYLKIRGEIDNFKIWEQMRGEEIL